MAGAVRRRTGVVLGLASALLSLEGLVPPGAYAQSVELSLQAGVDGSGDEQPKLVPDSPAEQLAQAETLLGKIQGASQTINDQLRIARKERDVVRVLCLNDKLNQVDVALSSAKDRMAALSMAVQRKDADRSRHEFTVLDVLADRVQALVNESSQCVGEETGFIGEAEVSVTIDPNLPDDGSSEGGSQLTAPPPPSPAIGSGTD